MEIEFAASVEDYAMNSVGVHSMANGGNTGAAGDVLIQIDRLLDIMARFFAAMNRLMCNHDQGCNEQQPTARRHPGQRQAD